MTRCLIIDDEPLARQLMESHIRQVKSLQVVGTCETAIEAFELLHREQIDLLFLDIQMPGITGLNFLKSLKNPPKVIFTTAYMEYAVEAFELEAVDYLLKPITFERFIKAVQKISAQKEIPPVSQSQPPDEAIFIKVHKRLLRIAYPDIFYIEGFGDYIKVVTANTVHTSYSSLNKIGELLPEQQFLRIHKSFIINVRHIQFVEGNLVRILDKELPIGVTYKDALYKKLGQE
ncbi:response regulator transcription factor [Pseudoflavitalea sp. X16]|uniref:LytR/AlgR family response regulator transcription factor n=1 Tax=Paraflavitalea devenefica TaxID=2716334 RepID=UPI001422627E|nr:response regulator transcription factor [Paraflavitalea devenefica]NII24847.1 response regulator transcription factor [Paraflavitalea devenefica]